MPFLWRGRLPSAVSSFPSPLPDVLFPARAATIRGFLFSFATPGCPFPRTGGYHPRFLPFLRHSRMSSPPYGRLPSAVSSFPSPLPDVLSPVRAATNRGFLFSFATQNISADTHGTTAESMRQKICDGKYAAICSKKAGQTLGQRAIL